MADYVVTLKYEGTSLLDRVVVEADSGRHAVERVVERLGIASPGAREVREVEVDPVVWFDAWTQAAMNAQA